MKKLLFLLLMGPLAFALETGASEPAVAPLPSGHYDIQAPFTGAEDIALDNALKKRIIYASTDQLIWVQVRDFDTPSVQLQASGALAISDRMPIRWCIPSENGCIAPPASACTFDKTRLSKYPGSFFYAPWCTGFIQIKLSQARSLAGEFDRISYFSDVMRYQFQGSAPANIDLPALASRLGETRLICTERDYRPGCSGYYAPASRFSASAGFSYDKAYASFNMIGNISGDSELRVSLNGVNADRYMSQAKTDLENALSSIGVTVSIELRNASGYQAEPDHGTETDHSDDTGDERANSSNVSYPSEIDPDGPEDKEDERTRQNMTYASDGGSDSSEDVRYNLTNAVYLQDEGSDHPEDTDKDLEDSDEERTNRSNTEDGHYAEYNRSGDREDVRTNSSNTSYAHDDGPEGPNETDADKDVEDQANESHDIEEQEARPDLPKTYATYRFTAKVKTPDISLSGFNQSEGEPYTTYSKGNIIVVISHPYLSLWAENISFSPDKVTASIVIESDSEEAAGNALSEKARSYGVNASGWSLDYYPAGNPQHPIRYTANDDEDDEEQTQARGSSQQDDDAADASGRAQKNTTAQTPPASSGSATSWQRSALGVFYNPVAKAVNAIRIAPDANASAPGADQKNPVATNWAASFKYILIALVALVAAGIALSVSRNGNIILDSSSFKALSSESRLSILRSLDQKDKTLTDLANELGLSLPTVKEHMDILLEAGLVVREETSRKWKYFSLTSDARKLLNNN